MQKITPNLWFDTQAEEAVKLYTSLFKNSKIGKIARYGESGAKISGQKEGSVMTINFELNGQSFVALNGGPIFKFNEAISLMIDCEDQAEVDMFWEKLSDGGSKGPCGWLKDKFGLSWQVVPKALGQYMNDPDPKKVERVMAAMLKMEKLDVEKLKKAYEQE